MMMMVVVVVMKMKMMMMAMTTVMISFKNVCFINKRRYGLVVYFITYFLWYFQLLPEPSELQDGSLQALDADVGLCDSTLDCARSHPDGRETQLSEKLLKQ